MSGVAVAVVPALIAYWVLSPAMSSSTRWRGS
jgi:hypothetical protein